MCQNESNLPYLSHAEVVSKSPSVYNLAEIIILSIIITAMMIVIVVGNMLVVIAIATENNLTTVQNWFIASLAVADMLIGLVVMPFSLSYELMGYWMFGKIWCDFHGALDVFLCTSSIMNICLISLDRYWSITKAISYLTRRTPNRVAVMIVLVWVLSGEVVTFSAKFNDWLHFDLKFFKVVNIFQSKVLLYCFTFLIVAYLISKMFFMSFGKL